MAIKVVNKSRQFLPVSIVKDGKEVVVSLLSNGPSASIVSEERTKVINNLEKKGLLAVRVIKEEVKEEEELKPKEQRFKKGSNKK